MKVNLDGLRMNASSSMSLLANEIEDCLKYLTEERAESLKEAYNDAARNVGLFNCVYSDGDDLFNDISESVTIKQFNEDTHELKELELMEIMPEQASWNELFEELEDEVLSYDWHLCLCHQRITDWSVEIYTGYKASYDGKFFTDGHISKEAAIKEGLEFMRSLGEGHAKED